MCEMTGIWNRWKDSFVLSEDVDRSSGPDIDAGTRVPMLSGMAPVLDYLLRVRDDEYLEPLKKVRHVYNTMDSGLFRAN